jgi:hypothetical protein
VPAGLSESYSTKGRNPPKSRHEPDDCALHALRLMEFVDSAPIHDPEFDLAASPTTIRSDSTAFMVFALALKLPKSIP